MYRLLDVCMCDGITFLLFCFFKLPLSFPLDFDFFIIIIKYRFRRMIGKDIALYFAPCHAWRN